jgi:hypothetical protein
VLSLPPEMTNGSGYELYVIGTVGTTLYANFGAGL